MTINPVLIKTVLNWRKIIISKVQVQEVYLRLLLLIRVCRLPQQWRDYKSIFNPKRYHNIKLDMCNCIISGSTEVPLPRRGNRRATALPTFSWSISLFFEPTLALELGLGIRFQINKIFGIWCRLIKTLKVQFHRIHTLDFIRI